MSVATIRGFAVLLACVAPPLRAFQAVSGSAEWLIRPNTVNADGVGQSEISSLDSMVLVRGRGKASLHGNTISGILQAYGTLAGDTSPALRVDEAYGTMSTPGGWTVTGGIQRYPGQYSTYWNPTFPIRPKMDLSRPDFFATGVPLVSVSRALSVFTPRVMALWRDGESYAGAQVDVYARTIEAYLNGFWSKDRERMLGAGLRGTIRGWTVHGEAGPLWRGPRPAPTAGSATPEGLGSITFSRSSAPRWRAAVGGNRTVLDNGLITMEYLYDGSGWSVEQFDTAAQLFLASPSEEGSALDPATAEAYRAGMLRRNHVHVGYQYSWQQKWRFAVRYLLCADDGSGYMQPYVVWAPTDHAEIGAELFLNSGTGRTEFGLFPVRTSVTLRFKYFL